MGRKNKQRRAEKRASSHSLAAVGASEGGIGQVSPVATAEPDPMRAAIPQPQEGVLNERMWEKGFAAEADEKMQGEEIMEVRGAGLETDRDLFRLETEIEAISAGSEDTSALLEEIAEKERRVTELEKEVDAMTEKEREVKTLKAELAEKEWYLSALQDRVRGLFEKEEEVKVLRNELKRSSRNVSVLEEEIEALSERHKGMVERQRERDSVDKMRIEQLEMQVQGQKDRYRLMVKHMMNLRDALNAAREAGIEEFVEEQSKAYLPGEDDRKAVSSDDPDASDTDQAVSLESVDCQHAQGPPRNGTLQFSREQKLEDIVEDVERAFEMILDEKDGLKEQLEVTTRELRQSKRSQISPIAPGVSLNQTKPVCAGGSTAPKPHDGLLGKSSSGVRKRACKIFHCFRIFEDSLSRCMYGKGTKGNW